VAVRADHERAVMLVIAIAATFVALLTISMMYLPNWW
jgi:hypothetical protein